MDVDELERLAALVQQANIRELTLREGEARITIRKSGQAHGIASLLYAPARAADEADTEAALVLHESDGENAPERVVFITSPLVGVFHHVNPVVGLGAQVKEGQTVGVIESMNLVHEVGATEHGIVTDVLIEDGVVVEYGQRLFALQAGTTRISRKGNPAMFRNHEARQRRLNRSGFSLIEILVVALLLVFIGGGLAYFYLGSGGKDKKGETKRTPITVAKGTVCKSNIDQVRQSLNVIRAGDSDEALPQSLAELKLPSELLSCAVGKEPYQYDPTTGAVRCVHPGHENF